MKYDSLYLLKTVGVLFVLMIHFHCYKSQYFEPLYRCGVLLFYIISGFFLYTNDTNKQISKIKKSISKIIKLILFFNITYYLLYWITEGKSKINNIDEIIRLIIYGDSISGHLWFLTSYLWTLIFFLICVFFKIKNIILYVIAIICLTEGLLEGQYSFVFNNSFSIQQYYLPWLTSSLPMMTLGYIIKKHEKSIVVYANKHERIMLLGTLFFLIFPYIEHHLLCMTLNYSGTFMISTFFSVIAIFIYCVCKPTIGKKYPFIITIGKKHSGNIYYWQFFPYYFFIAPLIPKDILYNIELPLMIIVLLVWSYAINWSINLFTQHKLI